MQEQFDNLKFEIVPKDELSWHAMLYEKQGDHWLLIAMSVVDSHKEAEQKIVEFKEIYRRVQAAEQNFEVSIDKTGFKNFTRKAC